MSVTAYSVRIGYRALDLYEDELYAWMAANTTWGEDGVSNYIFRFKLPAELEWFLLKWGSICEHQLNPEF